MENITLKNYMGNDTINVPAEFVDRYICASGDSIKLYLYLLRELNRKDSDNTLSVAAIADKLDITKNSVTRALRYWESENLIACSYTKNTLTGITLLPIPSVAESEDENTVTELAGTMDISDTATHMLQDKAPISDSEKAAIQKIFEKYLGIISPRKSQVVTDIIEELHFDYEMCEHLIEYCAKHDRKSIDYIHKVAANWNEMGLDSEKKICDYISGNDITGLYKTVCNTLALDKLAVQEEALVQKWYTEWHFSAKIIEEACIKARKQRYGIDRADTILAKWLECGVTTIDDVKRLDDEFLANLNSKASPKGSVASKKTSAEVNTKFTNFEQRNTNYKQFEKELVLNYKL